MSGAPNGMTKQNFEKRFKVLYPNAVHTSLTKDTKLLIVDSLSSNTSKMLKARKWNIPQVTYQNALEGKLPNIKTITHQKLIIMYKFEPGRWIKFTINNVTFIGVTMISVDDKRLISCINTFGQNFVYGFEKIADNCDSMVYLKFKLPENEKGLISHIRPQVMDHSQYEKMLVEQHEKDSKKKKQIKEKLEDIPYGAFSLDKIGEA